MPSHPIAYQVIDRTYEEVTTYCRDCARTLGVTAAAGNDDDVCEVHAHDVDAGTDLVCDDCQYVIAHEGD